jgi:hypothetical protein
LRERVSGVPRLSFSAFGKVNLVRHPFQSEFPEEGFAKPLSIRFSLQARLLSLEKGFERFQSPDLDESALLAGT